MWKEPHRNMDGETFGLREVYTVLVLGISGAEGNSFSRGIRSEVEGSDLHLGGSNTIHRPSSFSLCSASPGHHIAFKGATQMCLKPEFNPHFVDGVWTVLEVGWCA